MKIKMIDLLVRIASGEEVPKKIKFGDKIWKYNSGDKIWKYNSIVQDYMNEDNNEYLFANIFGIETEKALNYEVEIIEEPKKIEYPILHKTAPSETTGDQMPNWRNLIDCNFEHLNKTIYQLIDEINNLKENK